VKYFKKHRKKRERRRSVEIRKANKKIKMHKTGFLLLHFILSRDNPSR
jgi:hypothetical protein